MKKTAFLLWIFVLAIELFSFYFLIHRPYDISEIIFQIVLVVVMLVVGITAIFAFKDYK